jgi:hypothetical protein
VCVCNKAVSLSLEELMRISDRWVNREGPRVVALTGDSLYGLGVFLASFSANIHSQSALHCVSRSLLERIFSVSEMSSF